MNKKTKGFTLIELLVVIAIISLLSTTVMASLNSARSKARDTKRSADIRQVQTALELYYNDNNHYVTAPDVLLNDAALTSALTPTYMAKMPTAPSPGLPYRYYTASQNPAVFYAIKVPYENKPACYVCGGDSPCGTGGFWGLSKC